MNKDALAPLTVYVPAKSINYIKKLIDAIVIGSQVDEEDFWEEVKPLPDTIRPGKLLRGARLRADLTQKELAAMISVPQSHISQYETNKRKIPEDKAIMLAEILQTSAKYFM